MGVKTLWSVLSGTGEMIDLRELQGCTVAIDLAGWIVQNNTCKAMSGTVARPHLRNLFFRLAAIVNLNIKPIFVLDGNAPDLKKETLEARKKAETQSQATVEVKNFSRARLKGLMGECKALLDSLGISSVKAEGEAESLCAKLNAEGIVDAVISDDSDAFCYGAKVLLRNFSISTGNGACVEKYTIEKVDQSLKLDRNRLIFMAILLGCDFCPSGVPGVGKETVLQLFEAWPKSWNVLEILRHWITIDFSPKCLPKFKKGAQKIYDCTDCDNIDHCDECNQWSMAVKSWKHCHCRLLKENILMFKLEESIKKKCKELPNFWNDIFENVIDEFMKPSDCGVVEKVRRFQVNCPNLDDFVNICVKKMAWTEEYAVEKFLPIITRWQVRNAKNKMIQPIRIIKQRTVNGTPSFTLNWTWVNLKPSLAPENFETCEPAIYLNEFCQELIDDFEEKKKKPKKVKKKPTVVKSQPLEKEKITQFFKEAKKSTNTVKSEKTKDVLMEKSENAFKEKPINKHLSIASQKPSNIPSKKPMNLSNQDYAMMSEDESLPEDLSFLVEGILSQRIKRNLSIEQPKELVTSTPVNEGSRFKKLITPSKISNCPGLPIENLVENTDSDQENLLILSPKGKSNVKKVYPTKTNIQKDNPTKSKIQNGNTKPPRFPIDDHVDEIGLEKEILLPTKKISTKLEIQEDNPSKSKIHAVNPTKSKIQDDNPKIPMPEEEDFEDSFDRMCNVKSGFCSK